MYNLMPTSQLVLSTHEPKLLIQDQLISPPTWFASFRDLTLVCRVFLKCQVLIESEDPDPVYFWLKSRGGMDFVRDFVRPKTESGIRLVGSRVDMKPDRYRTIITDRIVPGNIDELVRSIRFCCGSG